MIREKLKELVAKTGYYEATENKIALIVVSVFLLLFIFNFVTNIIDNPFMIYYIAIILAILIYFKYKGSTKIDLETGEFIYEEYLEDFLTKNITYIEKELELYEQQYHTNIGIIDLLCKNRNHYVVVELKRGYVTSDSVIGQISRYIGWVKEELLSDNEEVRGIVIARGFSKKVKYASLANDVIKLKTYKAFKNGKNIDISIRAIKAPKEN